MQKNFPPKLSSFIIRTLKLTSSIVLGVSVVVILWFFQQRNIGLLDQKIGMFQAKIVQASFIDEKLNLEKDILGFEKDKTIIQNGAYINLVQALGGLAISITAWVGYQNLRLGEKNLKISEDKQVTERFSQSIEHLGSDKIDVRLGGIYALEQIAIDSSKYHWTVVEILSAFIREKCPLDALATPTVNSGKISLQEQSEQKTSVLTHKKVGVDIQAAVTVLGRRKVEQDPQGKSIDLRSVNIPMIEIEKANLSGANLYQANLYQANLVNANLSGANLNQANLDQANLSGANLNQASLDQANLNQANLRQANLRQASLVNADLYRADLYRAYLVEAYLVGAKLIRSQLTEADLTKANLYNASLSDATLIEANLVGANLLKADLSKAKLMKADLSEAILREANLRGVMLGSAKVGNAKFSDDQGLYDDLKKELEEKGAIFEDCPKA
jgi:uncharacterized protein YjbI with pentapeptide repeats